MSRAQKAAIRKALGSDVGYARPTHVIAVRRRQITDSSGKAAIYDLIIQVGKGRKHAAELRARIEPLVREALRSAEPR